MVEKYISPAPRSMNRGVNHWDDAGYALIRTLMDQGMKAKDIADRFGVSYERGRQLMDKAVRRGKATN